MTRKADGSLDANPPEVRALRPAWAAGSRIPLAVLTAAALLSTASVGRTLDGASAGRLMKAGVSQATLERIAEERTIETGAFTVEEIIAMKAAGIGEAALQKLVAAGSFMRDREPVVYGRQVRSIRLSTAEDIIALKKAGLSDEVLGAIVALNRPASETDREEALRLLNHMGIWVESDGRPQGPRPLTRP